MNMEKKIYLSPAMNQVTGSLVNKILTGSDEPKPDRADGEFEDGGITIGESTISDGEIGGYADTKRRGWDVFGM